MITYKFTNREDAKQFAQGLIAAGQQEKDLYHVNCKVLIRVHK